MVAGLGGGVSWGGRRVVPASVAGVGSPARDSRAAFTVFISGRCLASADRRRRKSAASGVRAEYAVARAQRLFAQPRHRQIVVNPACVYQSYRIQADYGQGVVAYGGPSGPPYDVQWDPDRIPLYLAIRAENVNEFPTKAQYAHRNRVRDGLIAELKEKRRRWTEGRARVGITAANERLEEIGDVARPKGAFPACRAWGYRPA